MMTFFSNTMSRWLGVAGPAIVALTSVAAIAVVLTPGLKAVAGEERHPDPAPYRGSDKAHYCNYCHGPSGRGYLGYQPIPRLAGQMPEYLIEQLRLFAEQRRDRHATIAMARVHRVGEGTRQTLAYHYTGLSPRKVGAGPASKLPEGRGIYEDGIPEANLPPCAACHGPDGRGNTAAPRLAGQLYAYTVRQLINWNRDRRPGSSNPDSPAVKMDIIARSMSRGQIEAVAAYLSRQD